MSAEAGHASSSPFRSWNDVERYEFVPGVHIKAAGGEQVCVCDVKYDAGKQVPLHAHEHTEQIMVIIEGECTVTVEGEPYTFGPGDVAVINRGREHSVYSEHGVRFIEALAPVPLDHIPDKQRDLVLGPDGGSGHVER
jgi:quercetin dioxygenase-like cupin family protein